MNTTTPRSLPISEAHLHGLIEQALVDLRLARRVGDASGAARCERRMNALLDQFASTGSAQDRSASCEGDR